MINRTLQELRAGLKLFCVTVKPRMMSINCSFATAWGAGGTGHKFSI